MSVINIILKLFKIRDYPMLLVGASHKYIYTFFYPIICELTNIHVQLNY